jgi:putative two-component system hydrogenase maturation factor HypX/HoxX
LIGVPGGVIAKRQGAICRAALDGAAWISRLRPKGRVADGFIKLPATVALGELLDEVPEVAVPLHNSTPTKTYRDIWYEEPNDVGHINFLFYNGEMGTENCQRLAYAVKHANRPAHAGVCCQAGGISSPTAYI